jgi:hypothetical protein
MTLALLACRLINPVNPEAVTRCRRIFLLIVLEGPAVRPLQIIMY